MATFLGAGLLVVGFVAIFKGLRLVEKSRDAVDLGRQAVVDLRRSDLDDRQKERVLQGHSLRLFSLFFRLAFGGAAAVLVPAGVVWLLAAAGLLSFDAVMELALGWKFLLGSTVTVILVLWLIERS
ncbi:MAG: hypothetical protein PVI57_17315 [Gemmatimonadota bacterium]|jgi:hypothetical protein